MKTLLLSYKFLFMTLMSLPLALCSKDDDPKKDFEPVTIDLRNTNVSIGDTEFEVQGFLFKVDRAVTSNLGGGGIELAYPNEDKELSSLELDLSNTGGISKISIALFNNCSACLDIHVLNENQIITEIKGTELQSGSNLVEIDIVSEITALRISSAEAHINSIKLE